VSDTKDYQELFVWLSDTEREIESYCDVLKAAEDENVRELIELLMSARDNGRELLEDGRMLRLGVIGQIKAGKSSLLNSLLFGGREVLPMAATPMTASLTHIVKSEQDEVEIEYYNHEEWGKIRTHAEEYRKNYVNPRREGNGAERAASWRHGKSPPRQGEPAPFLEASFQLVEMVKKNGLDVNKYIGQTPCYPASMDTLNQTLHKLVGAEGNLTPLVKSVKIRCSQGFPDIDIVDTPGINDPVTSRSADTRRLLSRCDAVVLLSYAGQFMDSEDAKFFQERAPAAGVARQLLLASKFDSALLDVAQDHSQNLDSAIEDCCHRLAEHAIEVLRRTGVDSTNRTNHEVRKDDILFVSSVCANLVNKPKGNWSKEEHAAFENLRKQYPDWLDPVEDAANQATKKNLSDISGWTLFDKRLDTIRLEKKQIIANKMKEFLEATTHGVVEKLQEIAKDHRGRRDELREGDVEKSRQQFEQLHNTVDSMSVAIESKWSEFVDSQLQPFKELDDEVYEEFREAKTAIRDADSRETRKRREKGLIAPLLRLLGLGGYESYEEEVTNRSKLQQVVEDYSEQLTRRLDKTVQNAFLREDQDRLVEELSSDIVSKISNEAAHSESFSPQSSRALRNAIGAICVSVKQDIKRPQPECVLGRDSFAFHEKSDAQSAITDIQRAANAWLEGRSTTIEEVRKKEKDIVPLICRKLEAEVERREDDYKDKKFKIQRYSLALDAIEQCIERAPR